MRSNRLFKRLKEEKIFKEDLTTILKKMNLQTFNKDQMLLSFLFKSS